MTVDTPTSEFLAPSANWPDHPLRARVLGEVHARPFRRIAAPHVFIHYAFHTASQDVLSDREYFSDWCRSLGHVPPDEDSKVHTLDLLGGNLRWEQHSEFVSYTFDAEPAADGVPGAPLPQDPFGARFRAPGRLLAAARVHVLAHGDDLDASLAPLDEASLSCAIVLNGQAFVATDFRPDRDGLVRIVIQDHGLSSRRLGSLVQSMLEIETYRVFALLGLPKALDQMPIIRPVEKRVVSVVENIRYAKGLSDDRNLLDLLSEMAAEVEASVANSSFRFGASRAYHEILDERLRGLGELPYQSWPTMTAFLSRRLLPAMRTCQAVQQRQTDLSDKLARIANLLRTRVEVELEEQNSQLLASMNQRVKQQLLLQQTVEGLSVAAVSYYVIGLISYFAKGITLFSHAIDPQYITALSVPPVVLCVGWMVHRIRKHHSP